MWIVKCISWPENRRGRGWIPDHRCIHRYSAIGKDVNNLQIEFNDAGNGGTIFDTDHGNGYRIVEAPMACATRVEIGNPILFYQLRLMGVPADNHMDTGGGRIEIQLVQVMEQVKENAGDFHHFPDRQCIGP